MKLKVGSIIVVLAAIVVGYLTYYLILPVDKVEQPWTGKQVYSRNCAGCHGVSGQGNGPAAEYLFPKPRDFTSGVYKFTSTPNGELPADKDLERVVKQGLNPGGMPGFNHVLDQGQIARVVDYIKTFSGKFKKQDTPKPIDVSNPPEQLLTNSRIEKGKKLYDKLGCASCHGPEGKGDGPTADQQTDRWGEPIPPRNLTRGNFKGGNSPVEVYKRIVTGITGTGMPPYGSALQSEDDRWALVAYVKSLSNEENTGSQPAMGSNQLTVKNTSVNSKKLARPGASVWETAERVRMPLYSLWLTDRTPFDSVEIRALHNGKNLAVWMSWPDPTKNMKPAEVTEYTDGVAVMFPNLQGAVPFLGMGESNMKGGLAHIWHWRASDQLAVNRGGATVDREDTFPTMQVDYYQGKDDYKPGTKTKFENRRQHTKNQPKLYQSGWQAGNAVSKPVIKSPVKSYRAKGFGTLTALDRKNMRVDGNGTYRTGGGWKIVLMRPLKTNTDVVQFEPGEKYTAAFAVWDGEQQDRNGQKDITSWITFELEQSK